MTSHQMDPRRVELRFEEGGVVSVPLVVDLDGTLLRTDMLAETAASFLARNPLGVGQVLIWLLKGKATLKRKLAEESEFDAATLPYREEVLETIRAARASGCRVYLASASDERVVKAVAGHLGYFDGWFTSDGMRNLRGPAKAGLLVCEFGAKAFDYIGNGGADVPVWRMARRALLVDVASPVRARLIREGVTCETIEVQRSRLSDWLRLLRPRQWVKNVLIFVPVLTAHLLSLQAFLAAALAFVAFSLCSSSAYVVNDLVDIAADRQHPTKKNRPFASGAVPLLAGAFLVPALLGFAFGIAASLTPAFIAALTAYLIATLAYSFALKRKMIIDAVVLAGLYTLRVASGAYAVNVVVSHWLFAFSIFLFFSLALIKRYSELTMRFDAGLSDPSNRNYKVGDLPVVASLAAASGFSAVIVFSLYLASDTVRSLYRRPDVLWLVCPLLMYWIARMLMMSHRRLIRDDPVVFAMRDNISLMTACAIAVIVALAL